jgi:hypothetical protein
MNVFVAFGGRELAAFDGLKDAVAGVIDREYSIRIEQIGLGEHARVSFGCGKVVREQSHVDVDRGRRAQ